MSANTMATVPTAATVKQVRAVAARVTRATTGDVNIQAKYSSQGNRWLLCRVRQ
jgi:hypothetical protein